jgi:hypothetical protein
MGIQKAILRQVARFFAVLVVVVMVVPAFTVFINPPDTGVASAANGRVLIETEMQVGGLGSVQGGGYVTWKFYDSAATELRKLLLDKYDGAVNKWSGKNEIQRDGKLQDWEISYWIGNEGDVEMNMKKVLPNWYFWGVKGGPTPGGFQPRHNKDNPISSEDCVGLIDAAATDTGPASIYWLFDMPAEVESPKKFNMQDQSLLWAAYHPLDRNIGDDYYNKSLSGIYDVRFKHTHYMLGLQSIYDPNMGSGSLLAVRTPIAEILWYDYAGKMPAKGSNSINPSLKNTATFSNFAFLENPAILFVFVFILTEIVLWIINKLFERYREKAQEKTDNRKLWKRKLTLHLLIYIFFILLWVFYFFPGMGFLFLGGLFIWVYGITISVFCILLTKFYYDKRLDSIKEEIRIPPPPVYIPPQPAPQPQPIHVHVMLGQQQPGSGQTQVMVSTQQPQGQQPVGQQPGQNVPLQQPALPQQGPPQQGSGQSQMQAGSPAAGGAPRTGASVAGASAPPGQAGAPSQSGSQGMSPPVPGQAPGGQPAATPPQPARTPASTPQQQPYRTPPTPQPQPQALQPAPSPPAAPRKQPETGDPLEYEPARPPGVKSQKKPLPPQQPARQKDDEPPPPED